MIQGPTKDQHLYSVSDLRSIGVSEPYITGMMYIAEGKGTQVAGLEAHFAYGLLAEPIRKLLDGTVAQVSGDKVDWLRYQVFRDTLQLLDEILVECPNLSQEHAIDIAIGNAWLKLIATSSPKSLGFKDKPDLLKVATLAIQRENLRCLNISSPDWLRKKLTAWKKEGWRSLVSRKTGKNALKRTAESDMVLMALFSRPNGDVMAECWHTYNELRATSHPELPKLSLESVRSFLKKPDVRNACMATRSRKNDGTVSTNPPSLQ